MTVFAIDARAPIECRTVRAVLFHEFTGDMDHRTLLTSHPVHSGENGPIIGAGQLVDAQAQQYMLNALMNNLKQTSLDFLPSNILAISARSIVWHVPAKVAPMYFQIKGKSTRLMVPWPHLVFKVTERVLSVAAVSVKGRPGPGSRLFHAPLMNIWHDSRVCTGSATAPTGWMVEHCRGWENIIYKTNFSHVNHDRTLLLHGGEKKAVSNSQHLSFWKGLAKSSPANFPKESLVSFGITLKEWIKR